MTRHGLLAPIALPAVGDAIDVAVLGGRPLPAHAFRVGNSSLTVGAPVLRDGSSPRVAVGTDVSVGWADAGRNYELRTWLAQVTHGDGARWLLEIFDGPAPVERRDHVRVALKLDVDLVRDGEPIAAAASDLSEGGMRAVVGRGFGLRPMDAVSCAFEIRGRDVEAEADVLRVVPLGRDHVEVALRFTSLTDPELVRVHLADLRGLV